MLWNHYHVHETIGSRVLEHVIEHTKRNLCIGVMLSWVGYHYFVISWFEIEYLKFQTNMQKFPELISQNIWENVSGKEDCWKRELVILRSKMVKLKILIIPIGKRMVDFPSYPFLLTLIIVRTCIGILCFCIYIW